ncbi:contractile injection system protein, VgrG/Pvc8 family [Succinimonas sp.]|uniref:contractile injection system protein, VgrG/Pvc8 family n=1 Tax=Succinimonas sp. TaxID=1936151 RepID=UPI0038687923
MSRKEIQLSFIKSCALADVTPYSCALNEGISIPFRARVTMFSDKCLRKKDLDDCLRLKAELTLLQYDDSGLRNRGRKFQGIVTSYRSLGLVTDMNSAAEGEECYSYEIIIEPEMALMGLRRRTRSFDSESTPADIITQIFSEYNLSCRFDKSLFDRMPDRGQIAQQNNETDLNFINRICFYYGFNYVFELEDADSSGTSSADSEFGEVFTVFSRGWTTGNAKQISGNTLTGLSEIPCSVNAATSESFGSDTININRLIDTGFAGSASIFRDDADNTDNGDSDDESPLLAAGFAARRGEGPESGESIYSFAAETTRALDRLNSGHALVMAQDFAVASGITLKTDSGSYLVARVSLVFTTEYPENSGRTGSASSASSSSSAGSSQSSSSSSSSQGELRLAAAALPVPEDAPEPETLGPLCCFNRISADLGLKNIFVMNAVPRPGRLGENSDTAEGLRSPRPVVSYAAAGNAGPDSEAKVYQAMVTGRSGKCSEEDESDQDAATPGTIAPADDDNTAFPAMFYALIDNAAAPVKVNYVSMSGSAAPLGNFPKVGQRVLLLEAGGRYYHLGYLPDREALPVYDTSLRDDLLHSSFLNSGITPQGAANADSAPDNSNRDINNQYFSFTKFSSAALLIEYLIMQGQLKRFMHCLALRMNTYQVTDIYDDYEDTVKEKLDDLISARAALNTALSENSGVNEAKQSLEDAYSDLSATAADIASEIKNLNAVSKRIKEMQEDDSSLTDDEAFGKLMGTASGALSFASGTSRSYASSSETSADDDITMDAGHNLTLNAGNKITITADSSIVLQVGNSKISINGNTLSLAVAYFKNKFSPWDGKISMSPTTGVKITGYQFTAKSLMSVSVGDSFGATMLTKCGDMIVTAPKIKMVNMTGLSFLKVITNLAGKLVNATTDTICTEVGGDTADLISSVVNDVTSYANSIASVIKDSVTSYKLFKNSASNTNSSAIRNWVNLICASISIAMDVADVLEDLIANTIIANMDSDYSFTKRNKSNNYISGHDKYRMITSSIRMTAQITYASLLMYDCLTSAKISSLELAASSTTFSGKELKLSFITKTDKSGPLNGTGTGTQSQALLIDENNDEGDNLISSVAEAFNEISGHITEHIAEKAMEEAATTNNDEKSVTGDTKTKVSEEKTVGASNETSGSKTEENGAKEGVSGEESNVNADKNDVNAAQTDTYAAGSETEAVKSAADVLVTDSSTLVMNT